MPGVIVTSATRTGVAVPPVPENGQWFLVGQAESGRTDEPIVLEGMADFDIFLGGRVGYGALYDQCKAFFDNGGTFAQVVRVVGGSPVTGARSLTDRAGSPVATLGVAARGPGAYSTSIAVEIRDGTVSNTFDLILTKGGSTVETYRGLTSPAEAVSRCSSSRYVVVTNLASATAAPNNNPSVISATALSAGDDNRSTVNTASYTDALELFGPELGIGAVSIPGQGAAVHDELIAHAEANTRVALLDASRGSSRSELIAAASALNSSSAGLFAPWVLVNDEAGGSRAISPLGLVAALRAQAQAFGAWTVPAGQAGIAAPTVLGLDQIFLAADASDLDDAGVSVIRPIAGTIRLYGWRSVSNDLNYLLLSVRDLLNFITAQCIAAAEPYVFATVDGLGGLLSEFNAAMVGVVDPIATAGGLYPLLDADDNEIDAGYNVDTGTAVNTSNTLASNTIRAVIAVRPSPSSALVEISVVRVAFNAAVAG